MAQADLRLLLTDAANQPVSGTVNVDFDPQKSSAGGESMETGDIDLAGAKQLTVGQIECLAGPGTLYRVAVESTNFRTYAFFQMMMENRVNKPPDNQIRLVVNPSKVKDISAPTFQGLPQRLRTFLEGATPIVREPEDKDIEGLSGAKLYDSLAPLRRASLLNLFTKAIHATSAGVFRFLEKQNLLLLRQDRFFTTIDPGVEEFLTKDARFKSAPDLLHDPLPGYERRGSFKSRDAHGNIQVTLMREAQTGKMAADIDIDEASGIEHGFEVIRNKFRGRTNPYLVRELLLLSDIEELTLDPGYRFVFK